MEYVCTFVPRLDSVKRGLMQLLAFWSKLDQRIKQSWPDWLCEDFLNAVVDTAPWFADAPRGVNVLIFGHTCQRQFAVDFVSRILNFLQAYIYAVSLWLCELGNWIFTQRQSLQLEKWRDIFSADNAHLRRSSGAWAVLLDSDIFVKQLGKALRLSRYFYGSPAARALFATAQQAETDTTYWFRHTEADCPAWWHVPTAWFTGAPDSAAADIAALPYPLPHTELRQFAAAKHTAAREKWTRARAMYQTVIAYEAFVQRPRRFEVLAQDILLHRARDAIDNFLPRLAASRAVTVAAARRRLKQMQDELDALRAYEDELRAMGVACMRAGNGAASFVPRVEVFASLPGMLGCL